MLMKRLVVMYGGLSVATVCVGAIVRFMERKPAAGIAMLVGAAVFAWTVRRVARNEPGALAMARTLGLASLAGAAINFVTGPLELIYFSIVLSGFQAAVVFCAWRALAVKQP